MKWKNQTVFFVACFFGSIYGLPIEKRNEEGNESICDVMCAGGRQDLNQNVCKCLPHFSKDHLTNTSELGKELEPKEENADGKKTKRETIMELINKRKNSKTLPKTFKLFSTEKPGISFGVNKYMKKPQTKSKISPLLIPDKQTPRMKEITDRLKELKARMSIKPHFQSRNAFSEVDQPKNLIKQLKERQEELIKEFKKLYPKSAISKDNKFIKEKVGAINHLQNRIDIDESSLRSKLKQKINHKKEKSASKIEEENIKKESVGISDQSSSTESPKTTSNIPIIVLNQSDSHVKSENVLQKENSVKPEISVRTDVTTKKSEIVSSALEKIKEKQKEAVMKLKDKLAVGKNKSKTLEVIDNITLP